MKRRRQRSCPAGLSLALAALLAGCIFAPRTVSFYDRDCRIVTRQMVLDSQQVASIAHCQNEGCLTLLVAMGAVSAVSAVVSGSVVVVGNVVYWFEKRSQCRPLAAPAAPAAPDAAPAADPDFTPADPDLPAPR